MRWDSLPDGMTMHELSIAVDLVEIAENAARSAGAQAVDTVYLRVGVLSGVVKEALLFVYDSATKDTLLENSRLEIEDVPLVVYCPDCQRESELPSIQLLQCPHCGAYTADVRQGRELEIVSVEIRQDETKTD